MLSSGSSYSVALPPPPPDPSHDGKKSQFPEAPREPILLRLPDEMLEQMIAAASTDRRSLRLASDAQGLSIIVGSDQQAYQLLKSNQDTDLQHCLYRSHRPESSSAGVQRLEAVANIVSQYSVRSAAISNRSSMAAAHLKERREEELSRKLSSRSVLLEQSQFDKKGKLAATTKTSKASFSSSSTRDQSRGSPMIRGPSSSMTSSSTPSSMSRSKSQAEVQLGSSRDTPPGSPAIRRNDVTRSPHPVTSTAPSSRAMTPSASSSGPSLRQRLLHLLAAGPQNRQRIVHSIPTSPEASILRLLSVVAICPDQKQTKASLYTLTDAAYKEVATHIGAGTWPLCSEEDKAVIVQQTQAALERQQVPKKAPEWKALAQWTGTVEESRTLSASTRRPRTDTAAPRRAGSPSSVTSSHSPTREGDDTDMESDKKAISTSTASRKASGSTTRERLTRAVKGRGSSKTAEEVKKQQEEKQRRRLEREQAEAGEINFRDATPMSQGMRRTASTSPSKEEQGKIISSPASPVAVPAQAKLKTTREERIPSASRDNAPQEPLPSVVRKERKRELEVESADSNPSTVPVKRSKVDASAPVDSKPSVAMSVSAPSHHGPSASASLTTAEPWLDVRTAKEWRHLAERFQRVWQRHEECAKALEWEKDRLKREREKAEVDALQEEVVDEGDTSREPEEKDGTATPRGKKDSSESKSSAERVPLEEGEEGSASSQEEGEELQPAVVDDVRRVVLVPLTVWREDDQSNKVTSQPSSTPSSAIPLSWDDLLRLVEAHRAREGELKRMKTALTSWKDDGGEV